MYVKGAIGLLEYASELTQDINLSCDVMMPWSSSKLCFYLFPSWWVLCSGHVAVGQIWIIYYCFQQAHMIKWIWEAYPRVSVSVMDTWSGEEALS